MNQRIANFIRRFLSESLVFRPVWIKLDNRHLSIGESCPVKG